jgi:cholesterol transport system auxiliary component
MRYCLIGLVFFLTLLSGTGCSISAKQPALHDFGSPASISQVKSKQEKIPVINVDSPTWFWDNRIRYRLLYSSPARVGFYTLDLWVAPPPELFEQLLISSGKVRKYSLNIWLQDFEQQFDAPGRAHVILRFNVEAYSGGPDKKVYSQEFYLEQPTATPNAAGAVNGFASLTRKAADQIQVWLAGLPVNRAMAGNTVQPAVNLSGEEKQLKSSQISKRMDAFHASTVQQEKLKETLNIVAG